MGSNGWNHEKLLRHPSQKTFENKSRDEDKIKKNRFNQMKLRRIALMSHLLLLCLNWVEVRKATIGKKNLGNFNH